MNEIMKVRVRVTQKDIDAPCTDPRSQNCPFARAIKRVLKHGFYPLVDGSRHYIGSFKNDSVSDGIKSPPVMCDWIKKYDSFTSEAKVNPIRVTLSLPTNVLKRVKG